MTYLFGNCEINPVAFEFSQAGQRVKVEPQVLELLLLLIENRDRIVSKDEIVEKVWNGRIVSDAAISSRIKTARQLIGDTGKSQEFIRTIHGRGFRFVAPVELAEPTQQAPAPAAEMAADLSPHPKIRYARSGEVHIAYELFGDGPANLVVAPGFVSQIDNYWDEPGFNRWLTALGKFARIAMFDKRGTGLSDQVPNLPGMDDRMDDVRAVMDAAGFEKAVILGISEGGSLASLYAASHPERVSGLILYGAFARFTSWFPDDAALQALFDYIESSWGTGNSVGQFAPSMVGNEEFRIWWGKFERLGATPRAVVDLMRMNKEIDISAVVPSITVPTLVIHRTQDTLIDVEAGRFLASHIPGARYIELPGKDHLVWVGKNSGQIIRSIEDFLASLPEHHGTERFVGTVLALKLTDAQKPPSGERSIAPLLEGPIRLAVTRNGGTLTGWQGDALTARFTGPARALRSAVQIVGLLHHAGLETRAGVHTGEVDLSETVAGGVAAAIASSVADIARAGQVLASRTVKDLVAGSGIAFEDAGNHLLDGIGEHWQLYGVLG
jgi:pimeloyl-ACP methyl ester carboxylesterase/DNA-binding winged helix-turn-helix (wHTH) protein